VRGAAHDRHTETDLKAELRVAPGSSLAGAVAAAAAAARPLLAGCCAGCCTRGGALRPGAAASAPPHGLVACFACNVQ